MTSRGLLSPAQVDPDSGYRWYAAGQLDNARLVASLRQIGVPLAQIQLILSLEPEAAAAQVGAYWSGLKPIMLPAGTWPATSLTAWLERGTPCTRSRSAISPPAACSACCGMPALSRKSGTWARRSCRGC